MGSIVSIISIIIKIDDVDGLTVVLVSLGFRRLAINHNVLVNSEHCDFDSFLEQVLFLEWKGRVHWLVESKPIKSFKILEEEDEEDGLARRSNVILILGALGESKGNSQIGRSACRSWHVDFLPNFF